MTNRTILVITIAFVLLIPIQIFAQQYQISVQTDNSQYYYGDTIFVTGNARVASGETIEVSIYRGETWVATHNVVLVSSDGNFKTEFPTDRNFTQKDGTYTIEAYYYQYNEFGWEGQMWSGETKFKITSEPKQTITIPEWIKNNANWWADGQIDDQSFVSGIEFLISDGVIDVPIIQKTVSTTDEIPSWIRTNANWWADGVISDSDFVKGIEYLVNSGIIQVKQTTQSQIDPPSLEIDAGPSDDAVEIIQESWMCSGNARCFTGTVTQVIDGDTIKVDGQSIRFAITSAPELNEPGGIEARNFIETICSVGSIATVDEDDGQTEGSYGRILGVIYCNGFNLNEDLLDVGHGYLISDFCDSSEFENESWAQKHGCSTISEPECPASHPHLWSDSFCYDEPEFLDNDCPRNYPYLWSDGLCYTVSEYLENGCPRGYPYIWSDGLCYNLPEPVPEETPRCDPSYPDVCITSYPPDLDCGEIPYTDFRVLQPDPHGFDADYDGIGCESYQPPPPTESTPIQSDCDPSYPDFCIPPPPPDLDCGDIPQKRFTVLQPDPHRFDGDKDGIGCE